MFRIGFRVHWDFTEAGKQGFDDYDFATDDAAVVEPGAN